MRKYLLLSLLAIVLTPIQAQQPAFDVSSTSWQQVIENARRQNKMIFVDVYTEWCGPCKWMDQNTFRDTLTIHHLNKNFYSVKIDAEKNFGIEFTKNYHVNAYPTYLFFNVKGELVQVSIGAMNTKKFIEVAESAIKKNKNGINSEFYRQQYLHKKNDITFLKEYIEFLGTVNQPNAAVIESYLQQTIKTNDKNNELTFLLRNLVGAIEPEGLLASSLLSEYKKYPVKSKELMSAWNTIRNKVLEQIDLSGEARDTALKNKIIQLNHLAEDYTFTQNRERDFLALRYYARSQDSAAFIDLAVFFINSYTNTDTLEHYDQLTFQKALSVKFPGKTKEEIEKSNIYSSYLKSFLSETERTFEEISEFVLLYKEQFPYSFQQKKSTFSEWYKKAQDIYQKNKIFVNSFITRSFSKNYENIFHPSENIN